MKKIVYCKFKNIMKISLRPVFFILLSTLIHSIGIRRLV